MCDRVTHGIRCMFPGGCEFHLAGDSSEQERNLHGAFNREDGLGRETGAKLSFATE